MKDSTYVELMNIAAAKEISMGRLLNDILDRACEGKEIVIKSVCHICGNPATVKAFKKTRDGTEIHMLCEIHFEENRPFLDGWTEI